MGMEPTHPVCCAQETRTLIPSRTPSLTATALLTGSFTATRPLFSSAPSHSTHKCAALHSLSFRVSCCSHGSCALLSIVHKERDFSFPLRGKAGMHWKGGRHPPHTPGRPAYALRLPLPRHG